MAFSTRRNVGWWGVGLVAALVLGAGGYLWRIEGYSVQLILSGSMQPAIPTGSVVLSRRLAPEAYKEGDIVVFRSPKNVGSLVTHRLKLVYINDRGIRVFQSKGDANSNGDPWILSVGAIHGKEILVIPYLGLGLAPLRTPAGFLIFSSLFFVFFIYYELRWVSWILGRRPGYSKEPS